MTPVAPDPMRFASIPAKRKVVNKLVEVLCLGAVVLGVVFLIVVLWGGIEKGLPRVSSDFLTSKPSEINPEKSGVAVALSGSLWVVVLTLLMSVPLGVAAAIYLEELSKPSRFKDIVQANIANLAGVPSIVFGLLGLAVFVRQMQLGQSVIAAALTMALLVLPTVILVTQEALRMVPKPLREGSLALGATRWQTLFKQTLPFAFPTILTGVIFSAARTIGETAPLIVVGATVFSRKSPQGIFDSFSVLPITIYNWSSNPKDAFKINASAAILVLLAVLLILNLTAIILRNKFSKKI